MQAAARVAAAAVAADEAGQREKAMSAYSEAVRLILAQDRPTLSAAQRGTLRSSAERYLRRAEQLKAAGVAQNPGATGSTGGNRRKPLVDRALGKALDKAESLPTEPEPEPEPEPEAEEQRRTLQMLRQSGTPERDLAPLVEQVAAAEAELAAQQAERSGELLTGKYLRNANGGGGSGGIEGDLGANAEYTFQQFCELARAGSDQPLPEAGLRQLFDKMDTDNSGMVSAMEFAAYSAKNGLLSSVAVDVEEGVPPKRRHQHQSRGGSIAACRAELCARRSSKSAAHAGPVLTGIILRHASFQT
jgi:hypothetical protein